MLVISQEINKGNLFIHFCNGKIIYFCFHFVFCMIMRYKGCTNLPMKQDNRDLIKIKTQKSRNNKKLKYEIQK